MLDIGEVRGPGGLDQVLAAMPGARGPVRRTGVRRPGADWLVRRWPTVVATGAAALALALAYLAFATPLYTSRARLTLESRVPQLLRERPGLAVVPLDEAAIAGRIEHVRSARVMEAAIRRAGLSDQPAFAAKGPGESVSELIRAGLRVGRVGRTTILEIAFTSPDPSLSAQIANAYAEAYIAEQVAARSQAASEAGSWLEERLAELRVEAVASDGAVQAFRAKHDLLESGGRTLADRELAELNARLVAARGAVADAEARVNGSGTADGSPDEVTSRLRARWLDAARREHEIALRQGSAHRAVSGLREEMEGTERLIAAERHRLADAARNDYAVARSREAEAEAVLDRSVQQTAAGRQAEVGLRMLESSARSVRGLHDAFLGRLVELAQQPTTPGAGARVISRAGPGERTGPGALPLVTGALLAGVAVGCGAARMQETRDRTVRTPRQVRLALGIPCVGPLPALGAGADDHWAVRAPLSRFAAVVRALKITIEDEAGSSSVAVLGIVAASPGDGSLTVAENLAALLATGGARTLLIGGPSGRSPGDGTGCLLGSVAAGRIRLVDAVVSDPLTGLHVLPACLNGGGSGEWRRAVGAVLDAARDRYDRIVVDLPALRPVPDAADVAHLIDAFVLVTAWGRSDRDRLAEILAGIEPVRERLVCAVLNNADPAALRRIDPPALRDYWPADGSVETPGSCGRVGGRPRFSGSRNPSE